MEGYKSIQMHHRKEMTIVTNNKLSLKIDKYITFHETWVKIHSISDNLYLSMLTNFNVGDMNFFLSAMSFLRFMQVYGGFNSEIPLPVA